MEIFKLFGSIMVDSTAAENSISRTGDKADGMGKKLGAGIKTAAKWGAGLVAGAAVAGAGIFALASKVSDTASEINDMSVRTGLSTTRLQELKFAAEQSGVSFDSIQSAVSKMTMSMGDASVVGSSMALSFEKLGVKTTDASGAMLDTQTVFDQSLVKLSEMDNATERNALGMEIFGKGFTELSPLVSGGAASLAEMSAKAHDLGLVLSEDAISAGDQFGDSLDAMKATLGGVVATIGVQLMPIFQSMMDWVMAHMPEIQAGIETAFNAVGTVISTTIDTIKSLTQFFQEHWDIIQPILAGIGAGALTFGIYTLAINAAAIATGIWSTVTGIATVVGGAFAAVIAFITSPIGIVVISIGLLIAAGILLYKNWDTVSAFLKQSWEAIKTVFSTVWNNVISVFTSVVNKIKTLGSSAWGFLKDGFSGAIKFVVGTFTGLYDKVIGSLNKLIGGIKDKVRKAKEFLSELNPFKRHSPSLVDNVLAGMDVIKKTYAGVSDMTIAPPSIGAFSAGPYTVGMLETGGGTRGSGGGTNYNAPLVQVANMTVRNDKDVRDISSELYNLQRNADRQRGR